MCTTQAFCRVRSNQVIGLITELPSVLYYGEINNIKGRCRWAEEKGLFSAALAGSTAQRCGRQTKGNWKKTGERRCHLLETRVYPNRRAPGCGTFLLITKTSGCSATLGIKPNASCIGGRCFNHWATSVFSLKRGCQCWLHLWASPLKRGGNKQLLQLVSL